MTGLRLFQAYNTELMNYINNGKFNNFTKAKKDLMDWIIAQDNKNKEEKQNDYNNSKEQVQ